MDALTSFRDIVFLRGLETGKRLELIMPLIIAGIAGIGAYWLGQLFPESDRGDPTYLYGVFLFAGWALVAANTQGYLATLVEVSVKSNVDALAEQTEARAIQVWLVGIQKWLRRILAVIWIWALVSVASCLPYAYKNCEQLHVVRHIQEWATIGVFAVFVWLDVSSAKMLKRIARHLEDVANEYAAIKEDDAEKAKRWKDRAERGRVVGQRLRLASRWCAMQVFAVDLPVVAGVALIWTWSTLLIGDGLYRDAFLAGAVIMHIQFSQLVYLWLGSLLEVRTERSLARS